MIWARAVLAVFTAGANAGLLALFSDAPQWGLWMTGILSFEIIFWATYDG